VGDGEALALVLNNRANLISKLHEDPSVIAMRVDEFRSGVTCGAKHSENGYPLDDASSWPCKYGSFVKMT
jgi:hypothetical protein